MDKLNENIIHLYNKWKEGYTRKETALEEKIKQMRDWAKGVFEPEQFDKMEFGIEGITVNCSLEILDYILVGDEIPYPFLKSTNTFSVYGGIISLKNCPRYAEIFDCGFCSNIASLEGAPEKVENDFNCQHCANLASLEGAPKYIGRDFSCNHCTSLTSLEEAPKKVGGEFDCSYCKSLTSLKGAPEEVGDDFVCSHCPKLTSLEGAPKKIDGNLFIDERFREKIPDDVTIGGDIVYV